MFSALTLTCAFSALTSCIAYPAIFGAPGAESPVPRNSAQYLLDLEAHDIYLHYYGDQQLFTLRFSQKLKEYLESVARTGGTHQMPVVYGMQELAPQGTVDWSARSIPRWTPTSGADAQHVFYGREVRDVEDALYGNSIHLSLGPREDPEGWTVDEMQENRKFAEAIRGGMSVGEADQYRQFRHGVAHALGGDFMRRFGEGVTTKAHRFALQMYSSESQSEANNPGARFFEMFPGGKPPTETVMFIEAEDGCKGTPTLPTQDARVMQKVDLRGARMVSSAVSASRAADMSQAKAKLIPFSIVTSMGIFSVALLFWRRSCIHVEQHPVALETCE
mmetsp:Transcript_137659/g.294231  ORF Transcript_137659/g.294231 Transcript_137659/m.294231 type:complete len:333 (+) Transcript_137659:56-1054(+)